MPGPPPGRGRRPGSECSWQNCWRTARRPTGGDLGDRVALSRQIRALSDGLRAAGAALRAESVAADALRLADRLGNMAGRGVSVEQVVEAERNCFRWRFGREDQAAGDRYRKYLAGSA